MSTWLIAVVTLIYTACAIEQGFRGNVPLTIIYSGYTIANIGLWKMT